MFYPVAYTTGAAVIEARQSASGRQTDILLLVVPRCVRPLTLQENPFNSSVQLSSNQIASKILPTNGQLRAKTEYWYSTYQISLHVPASLLPVAVSRLLQRERHPC